MKPTNKKQPNENALSVVNTALVPHNDDKIIIYQPDSTIKLDVLIENETVWLTQAQMAELFMRNRTVITRHIYNVFSENELDEKSNVHFLHFANSDKPVKLYSLDVIISVGYRVKSQRGTMFRRWASTTPARGRFEKRPYKAVCRAISRRRSRRDISGAMPQSRSGTAAAYRTTPPRGLTLPCTFQT